MYSLPNEIIIVGVSQGLTGRQAWIGPGSSLGLRGERQLTTRPSRGTALCEFLFVYVINRHPVLASQKTLRFN